MTNEQQVPKDAWLAAETEAVDGFEDVVDGGVDEPVGEPVKAEPEPDVDVIDEPEPESDEPEDAAEGAAPLVEYEWDGDPAKLPPEAVIEGTKYDLRKTFKTMQAGYTKRMQEVAEERRALEAERQRVASVLESQRQQQAMDADKRPADPTQDMSETEASRRWDEIQQWNARQAYRDMVAKGVVPDPERVKRQTAEYEAVAIVNRRMAMIQSLDGWDDSVGLKMSELAESDPETAQLLTTDGGAKVLFRMAKKEIENAALKAEQAKKHEAAVRRKAQAPRNAVSRSTSARGSGAAENFKKWGFAEAEAAALEEHGG